MIRRLSPASPLRSLTGLLLSVFDRELTVAHTVDEIGSRGDLRFMGHNDNTVAVLVSKIKQQYGQGYKATHQQMEDLRAVHREAMSIMNAAANEAGIDMV